ncbi:hypothetical protein C8R43DRAFT_1190704 [Mycena crocata]|nr:hypothetical protein C8R43DRAFT_1190704 [Mycena crocata]
MLLLLFLIHTFFTNGRPQLDSRALTQSCDNINECRKLFDIVWGCLVTIFACTWVSVHPNVPPPDQSWLALFFLAKAKADAHREYLTDICGVEAEDIEDKSKDDVLSKGVILVQGLWFTTQCIACVQQGLPVFELEVATLAFAVVNIFIYALWWRKPLDVQRLILVGPKEQVPTTKSVLDDQKSVEKFPEAAAEPWHGNIWSGLRGALTGNYGEYDNPASYTSIPSFWSSDKAWQEKFHHMFYIECLVGTIFGCIHCAAWNADFPSTKEMWMWRSTALVVAVIPGLVAGIWAVSSSDIPDDFAMDTISKCTIYPTLTIYPIARLFLIVLPLIAL